MFAKNSTATLPSDKTRQTTVYAVLGYARRHKIIRSLRMVWKLSEKQTLQKNICAVWVN